MSDNLTESANQARYVQALEHLQQPFEADVNTLVDVYKKSQQESVPFPIDPAEQAHLEQFASSADAEMNLYRRHTYDENGQRWIEGRSRAIRSIREVVNKQAVGTPLSPEEKVQLGEAIKSTFYFLKSRNEGEKARKGIETKPNLDPNMQLVYDRLKQDPLFANLMTKVDVVNDAWLEVENSRFIAANIYPAEVSGKSRILATRIWNRDREYTSSPAFRERIALLEQRLEGHRLTDSQISQLIFLHEFGHAIQGILIKNNMRQSGQTVLGQEAWKVISSDRLDQFAQLLSDPSQDALLQGLFSQVPSSNFSITHNESIRMRMKEMRHIGKISQSLTDEVLEVMDLGDLLKLYEASDADAHTNANASQEQIRDNLRWKYSLPTENFADVFAVAVFRRLKLQL